MGILKDYLTGKTAKNIQATKKKVQNVRALRKFKSGGQLSPAERLGAKRAASRLGDSMAAFTVRSPGTRRKK